MDRTQKTSKRRAVHTEMREVGLHRTPFPFGRTFLLSLAVADVAATALTLLAV